MCIYLLSSGGEYIFSVACLCSRVLSFWSKVLLCAVRYVWESMCVWQSAGRFESSFSPMLQQNKYYHPYGKYLVWLLHSIFTDWVRWECRCPSEVVLELWYRWWEIDCPVCWMNVDVSMSGITFVVQEQMEWSQYSWPSFSTIVGDWTGPIAKTFLELGAAAEHTRDTLRAPAEVNYLMRNQPPSLRLNV